ncbi:MAG: alcohol dehydrogenase catalytic domain-containing protein [Acidobacteria bacterium]|nr:alcohol dehydrogenase catalytic domain-containing protein [Acidobacteriota bacterium]
MNPIDPHQVVVKVQAAQGCYTIVGDLDPDNLQTVKAGTALTDMPYALGHGAVGIVEEVGPMVKRVKKGDYAMVCLGGTCGQCYQCLHGRSNACQSNVGRKPIVVGTLSDGSPVGGNLAGCAEYVVAWEESMLPVFASVPAVELASLTCPMACGLGMAMVRSPIEWGSSVAVFGAGPIGLSSVMGARLMGASQIIVVEPIRYRRELALKNGATYALNPNDFEDGAALVAHIKGMVGYESERPFAGGRSAARRGPDFIIEAVGGEKFPPRVERYAREPHGIEVLQNVFALCPAGGMMRTCGWGYTPDMKVTFWAGDWANGSKHQTGGNMAAINTLRDIPRWIRMMEAKELNGAAVVGTVSSLDRWKDAFEACGYRTAITGIVTPNGPTSGPPSPTTA